MRNLAGDERADSSIHDELEAAGIPCAPIDSTFRGEVPATVEGRLGAFTFHRLWYYWSVRGPMPLDAARRLYADPVGSTTVRVAGHCGCPPPDEWADGGFVHSYHIDSAAGLRLFADAVRSLGHAR